MTHAFDVLGDPARRRILELLSNHELSSGAIVEIVGGEFGITQPAVSQHLRTLRENGFATVTEEGSRRIYALNASGLEEVDHWLAAIPAVLGTEVRSTPHRDRKGEAETPKKGLKSASPRALPHLNMPSRRFTPCSSQAFMAQSICIQPPQLL